MSFEEQLENFRQEAYEISQYVYADMAVKHAASKSKKLLAQLNMLRRFWHAHAGACQSAAYVAIGRVFDFKSPYNLCALLNEFERSLHLFGRDALRARKMGKSTSPPAWIEDYLDSAYYPDQRDVKRLRKKVSEQREFYNRAIKPVRHKYLAHREKVESDEVQAMYGAGKVRELWKLSAFLLALNEALWQLYINGRKPIIRLKRYSVRSIYDAKHRSSDPHEAIVEETKALMRLLVSEAP
jgi:hypothetical protein